jgi:hypothetical protein
MQILIPNSHFLTGSRGCEQKQELRLVRAYPLDERRRHRWWAEAEPVTVAHQPEPGSLDLAQEFS